MKSIAKVGSAAAITAMALSSGCSMMQNTMHAGHSHQVSLTGASEVPPVATGAAGSGRVTVGGDCSVTARIAVTGMTATAAHIHQGATGANGPVIVPLTKSGDNVFTAPDGARMTPEQCSAFRSGMTYVNVHSDAHKGGEVRAQLKGS